MGPLAPPAAGREANHGVMPNPPSAPPSAQDSGPFHTVIPFFLTTLFTVRSAL